MKGSIYVITNDINDKVYVGQTTQSIEHRFQQHKSKGTSPKLANAFNKYGKEHFSIQEIESVEEEDKKSLSEKLDSREVYWINKYNAVEAGYNCMGGGQGERVWTEEMHIRSSNAHKGYKWSVESKKKLSESIKSFYKEHPKGPMSEEQKKKLSEDRKGKQCGKDNPFYGKTHTEEAKKVIGEKCKASWKDPNSKLSTQEYRDKQRMLSTGRKHSDTAKKLISEKAVKRPVEQYDTEGNFIAEYPSIRDAASHFSNSQSHIADVCNGKRRTCYGYTWKWADNN